MLRRRAALLQQIRSFFDRRGVLEVETPCLLRATASDTHLESFELRGDEPRYLQTSPEFAMKRLLAAGSGAIYQLCKCFRRGESSSRHNPEFTMLEWYRPDFDQALLMAEVAALVADILGIHNFEYHTYQQIFEQYVGLNPHRASDAELAQVARSRLDFQARTMSRTDWLDLLMSHLVEPELPGAVFVSEFPWQQASLSRIANNTEGQPVACRFELFIDGIEIANGYHELLDAVELQRRADVDNEQRRDCGLPEMPLDTHLLAAHQHGLPPCAGVAVGVDRLLMLQNGVNSIDQVLAFSDSRL
jgi:lysyl-tRNA synthetase class 2